MFQASLFRFLGVNSGSNHEGEKQGPFQTPRHYDISVGSEEPRLDKIDTEAAKRKVAAISESRLRETESDSETEIYDTSTVSSMKRGHDSMESHPPSTKASRKHRRRNRKRRRAAKMIPTDGKDEGMITGQDEPYLSACPDQPVSLETTKQMHADRSALKGSEDERRGSSKSGTYPRNSRSMQPERSYRVGVISVEDHQRDLREIADEADKEIFELRKTIFELREEMAFLRRERNEAQSRAVAAEDSCERLKTDLALAETKTITIQQSMDNEKFRQHAIKHIDTEGCHHQEKIERLERQVKKYQKFAAEAVERKREAEYIGEKANIEIKRLQTKEYEATRQGPVLLDEDAQKSIENIFGQQLRTWSRMSFRGLKTEQIIDGLQSLDEGGAFNNFLCKEAFIAELPLVLKTLGPVAFFEALVSSTLMKHIFKNHFFFSNSKLQAAFTEFREAAEYTRPGAAFAWTAKTVELLEDMARKPPNQTSPMGTMIEPNFCKELTINLNGYMGVFMDKNERLDEEKKLTNESRLGSIIQDCVRLALDWHKRNMHIEVMDKESLEINSSSLWNANGHIEYCSIYKGRCDEISREERIRVIAVVTPGFARFSDFEGKKLSKPIIWANAVLAVAKGEDVEMEDTVIKDRFTARQESIVEVPGTPDYIEPIEAAESQVMESHATVPSTQRS